MWLWRLWHCLTLNSHAGGYNWPPSRLPKSPKAESTIIPTYRTRVTPSQGVRILICSKTSMDWQIYKKVFYFGRTLFYGPTQPSLLSTNPWSSVSTLSAQQKYYGFYSTYDSTWCACRIFLKLFLHFQMDNRFFFRISSQCSVLVGSRSSVENVVLGNSGCRITYVIRGPKEGRIWVVRINWARAKTVR